MPGLLEQILVEKRATCKSIHNFTGMAPETPSTLVVAAHLADAGAAEPVVGVMAVLAPCHLSGHEDEFAPIAPH